MLRNSEYSELFVLVISNLCETEQDDRCTTRQIYEWLQPHEEQISALEDFQVNVLPERVDRTKNKALGSVANSSISAQNRVTYPQGQIVNSQIHTQHVQHQQPHQYPPQLISQLPPGAKISGPPLTLEQVKALQRG